MNLQLQDRTTARAEQEPLERILVVDDDPQVARLLTRLLEHSGYSCAPAADAAEARELIAREPFALILCDVNLPGESGLDLVEDVLSSGSDIAALMVSGTDAGGCTEAALELGAYGYILKPFRSSELLICVANALRRRTLEIENNSHREQLERTVRQRTAELSEAFARQERYMLALRASREETIWRLSRAVELRDPETGGHIERMSCYCGLLADRLGIEAEAVRLASLPHDVGKVAVPDRVLLKPDELTPEERRQMELHAEAGYRILTGSSSELLELAAQIAWTHHERFDGSGYPRGLAGEDISLEGRIAAVADVFDALTSDRVYRPAFPLEQAIEMMRAERATQFDPSVLDIFIDSMDDVLEIKERHAPAAPGASRLSG